MTTDRLKRSPCVPLSQCRTRLVTEEHVMHMQLFPVSVSTSYGLCDAMHYTFTERVPISDQRHSVRAIYADDVWNDTDLAPSRYGEVCPFAADTARAVSIRPLTCWTRIALTGCAAAVWFLARAACTARLKLVLDDVWNDTDLALSRCGEVCPFAADTARAVSIRPLTCWTRVALTERCLNHPGRLALLALHSERRIPSCSTDIAGCAAAVWFRLKDASTTRGDSHSWHSTPKDEYRPAAQTLQAVRPRFGSLPAPHGWHV
eukprot:SAG22_NODE_150_length_17426_cov_8.082588_18_plen_261_part_00